MAMVFADPEMLDRLAKSLDSKAGAIPQLKSRASALDVGGHVSGLPAIASWLGDTAKDLRRRANILRAPSESPFDSLAAFGLPPGVAGDPDAGKRFQTELKAILEAQKNGTPQQRAQAVKDYFATLTPAQQAALASTDPLMVGNLDGVPVNVRFAANRITIQSEYTKEAAFLATLKPTDGAYKRTKERVDTLRSFLNPRQKTYLDPKTGQRMTVEVPRQFLVFDPHFGSTADAKSSPFPDGRIAEVVGDLENADNVAFRVPGITNRLDNFNGFSSGGYELVTDAKGNERPDSAVVSWLGYDTPELGDSVDPAKAVAGGSALNAFRQGISVNLKPNAGLDIFAHSYGTLVTSKALQGGLTNVDNVTFMGSPGLGPNIKSVADFNMPNTKFYAMRAPGDWVSYTQGHGNDPADFKDITRLATDGAHGHSQYYNSETGSLANMHRIFFGGDAKPLSTTRTTLDDEQIGAAEAREMVGFLNGKIPPDVVIKMGGELNGAVQDHFEGRTEAKDLLLDVHAVLGKYNMLDRLPPDELFGKINDLGGNLAYKETYKAVKDKGAPDFIAAAAAKSAEIAAQNTLYVVTWPVVKALEVDRIANNVNQLGDVLDQGAEEIGGHVRELGTQLGRDGARIYNDTRELTGGLFRDGGRLGVELGDTLVRPWRAGENAGDIWKIADGAKDKIYDKVPDIAGGLNDAKNTVVDKGGDIARSTVEHGSKALDKGKNIVEGVGKFIGL
ncbi:alpha/beta hydrolase [Streptomyces sp. NPDC058662]|uniref:alpha/beta hydrolase n=1 Tax=Streptomyces sp. NPDC058662 TaxID=3346583 RepID=UPI00364A9EA4